MPDKEEKADWLGDVRWQGYPKLAPMKDVAGRPDEPDAPRPRKGADVRVETLARENEALRRKLDSMSGLVAEFERRMAEAASAYEGASLEAESARRSAELETARLAGELESARAELARREARDLSREADLTLERERRADLEKALLDARRRLNDLEGEVASARSKSAELAGSIGELRRQAAAANEKSLQAKAVTDQDVQLLRQEMREFLAKFHRIEEELGDSK